MATRRSIRGWPQLLRMAYEGRPSSSKLRSLSLTEIQLEKKTGTNTKEIRKQTGVSKRSRVLPPAPVARSPLVGLE